ncbi:DNA repair protein [Achromobacter pestifer]|uniref:DNA repair protein n=1 Tax=Achromobacter pestifer TaxID=1353889 RepID=A0A6S6YV92_9BURK|nr:DNA repair protein [Achromobacter pestifer]CAB3647256.1 hypothetical protein LMG3431_02553 [Achromobacter pestifer]
MKQPVSAAALWIAALMLIAPGVHAQSIEDRLRTELRSTTGKLQQIQSQQAQLTAAKATAEAERDAANKELATLRAQADSLRKRVDRLEGDQETVKRQAQAQVASSREQATKVQSAFQTLEGQARALQSEAATLKTQLTQRDGEYQVCLAKNQEMYSAGRELLTAYESVGTGDLFAVRQPFSGRARVLFDEKAQEFGDRLYKSQVGAGTPPDQPAGP